MNQESSAWPVAIGPVALKTASSNFVQKKNRKKLKLQLFRANGGGGGGDAFQKDHWTLNKQRKRDGVLGKVSGVAVTLKQWWRDVGLCPRAAPSAVGGPLAARHRCCHTKRGSNRSMGQSFSMCKLNHCRHKKSLHLRSSGDDCRMPAEGGVPSSESAHRERLQKHNNHAGHGSSYYDPEYARMEAWLDEHPDFVQDYFLRYMTECCDVERWRISMRPRCHPQIRHDPRRVPFKEQVDKLNVNSSELLRFFRFRITGNGLRKKQREFMVGQKKTAVEGMPVPVEGARQICRPRIPGIPSWGGGNENVQNSEECLAFRRPIHTLLRSATSNNVNWVVRRRIFFYRSYRKATRQVVDSWLVSHATPTSSSVELASPTHNQSRAGSGATTPVRKISAHEFERGGLLKPMISTIDGQPTFLTGSAENQVSGGPNSPTPGRRQRRSRHELRHLDEKELIFELVSTG
ncbi:hypothetical protein GEV33_003668 [Tenebrio molitor]|uniref:Uncharacterized protein n=1 Tax=Tenebrio molitor TaxID=7067 RepID=A0A8J6HT39_TENMO|nr:hypothetical protein GEV33_003668 [Tenebrio molitor]